MATTVTFDIDSALVGKTAGALTVADDGDMALTVADEEGFVFIDIRSMSTTRGAHLVLLSRVYDALNADDPALAGAIVAGFVDRGDVV